MKTLPVSGRVSMVTTGMSSLSSCSSVGAIAAVSCGAITMALASRLVRVWTLATRLVMSLSELVVSILAPNSSAICGV